MAEDERLLFELYVAARHDEASYQAFLDEVIGQECNHARYSFYRGLTKTLPTKMLAIAEGIDAPREHQQAVVDELAERRQAEEDR